LERIGETAQGRWNRVFRDYKRCKNFFELDNRKIYNATVGGKLEVFERIKLEEVIND